VLRVLRIARDQRLQDLRGLRELAGVDVRLGQLAERRGGRGLLLPLLVHLAQAGQARRVSRVALDDLLQEGGRLVRLAPVDVPLDRRTELLERLVELVLLQEHAAHLQAALVVVRRQLEQAPADGLGLLDLPRAEVRLAQAGQDLRILRRLPHRLLEVVHRAVVVLLDEVHARQLLAELQAGGIDLEPLLQDLQRLRQVALLVELLGDRDVLPTARSWSPSRV
jgi:hypothetical protein